MSDGSGSARVTAKPGSARRSAPTATTSPLIPCLLAWVLPGAGHFYLGRRQKAILFLVIVMGLFVLGLALHGKLYEVEKGQWLSFFATFACLGNGPWYFVVKFAGLGQGSVELITYEYGCTFILSAGLMNLLLILDVYDIAVGRK